MLGGKAGSFALAHRAEMNEGHDALQVSIVPGSGTHELVGIRGELQIKGDAGKHHYTLTYWIA